MKKIIAILILVLLPILGHAQHNSCVASTTTNYPDGPPEQPEGIFVVEPYSAFAFVNANFGDSSQGCITAVPPYVYSTTISEATVVTVGEDCSTTTSNFYVTNSYFETFLGMSCSWAISNIGTGSTVESDGLEVPFSTLLSCIGAPEAGSFTEAENGPNLRSLYNVDVPYTNLVVELGASFGPGLLSYSITAGGVTQMGTNFYVATQVRVRSDTFPSPIFYYDNQTVYDDPSCDYMSGYFGDPGFTLPTYIITLIPQWEGTPVITMQPTGQSVCAGAPVQFSINAFCLGQESYQWQSNGANIVGATNNTYSIGAATAGDSGTYCVVVSNLIGTCTSSNAVLEVSSCPPMIITQPLAQIACVATGAEFVASGSGSLPLSAQWQLNGTNIPGATNLNYSIASVAISNAGVYNLVLSNVYGVSTSSSAILTLLDCGPEPNGAPPQVQIEPTNFIACVGELASFTAQAAGTPPFTYQWVFNGTNISGATNSNYTPSAGLGNSGAYTVIAANIYGIASNECELVVTNCEAGGGGTCGTNFPPLIETAPTNQTVCSGDPVMFSVSAIGTPSLSYQWSFAGVNIPGATNTNFSPSTSVGNGGSYTVTVGNTCGTASATANLTITDPSAPVTICTEPPTNISVYAGENAIFRVGQCGGCPVTYQWFKAGYGNLIDGYGNVQGGQNATMTLASVSSNDNGTYSVIISNGYYSVTSTPVTLAVVYTNDPPTISNVAPIQAASANGSFTLNFGKILEASDAVDYNGAPITFLVDSVTNGQLTINGLPFAPASSTSTGNCLLNPYSVIVWTPAGNVPQSGIAAFKIRAYDGVLASTNSATVSIIQVPQTTLLGWGYNQWFYLGTGQSRDDSSPGLQMSPANVAIMGDIVDIRTGPDCKFSAAVTQQGNLWMWGLFNNYPAISYAFGQGQDSSNSLVWYTPGVLGGVPFASHPSVDGESGFVCYPVPVKVQMVNTNSGLLEDLTNVTGVSIAEATVYVVRSDGTLWSWGNETLGYSPSPLMNEGYYGPGTPIAREVLGMTDWQGNKMKVRQAIIGQYGQSALVLGMDGSVWGWGFDTVAPCTNIGEIREYLTTNSDSDLPGRLPAFGTNNPVIQISSAAAHHVALRADGTVEEFGHVPILDGAGDDCLAAYTNSPVLISNIPTNIIQVAALNFGTVALGADGGVYFWGYFPLDIATAINLGHISGVTYIQSWAAYPQPTRLLGFTNIVQISVPSDSDGWDIGSASILALDNNGRVFGAGENDFGELLDGTNSMELSTNGEPLDEIEYATSVFARNGCCFAVAALNNQTVVLFPPVALDHKVQLSWNIFPGAAAYNVYRALTTNGPFTLVESTTNTTFLDTGLTDGTCYFYAVTAIVNTTETPYSDLQPATPFAVPGEPAWSTTGTNTGIIIECHDIQLFWQSISNASVYQVYRASSSPTNPFVSIGSSTSYTFTDTSIETGTAYYYYVVAGNGAGFGTPSPTNGPVDGGSGCAPAPVISGLSYVDDPDDGDSDAQITWSYPLASTNGLQGFQVGWYISDQTNGNVQPPNIGSHFTYDYIYFTSDATSIAGGALDGFANWISGTNLICSCDWDDLGDSPDAQVWFKVTAIVNGSEGADSDLAGPIADCATCAADAPGQVAAVPGDQQVYLQWQQATYATVYDVEYTNDSITNWTLAATNLNDIRFWHTNLINGTTYCYRIIAKTASLYTNAGGGDSEAYITNAPSEVVCATPNESLGPKTTFTFTAAADGYDGMVYVHWESLGNPPAYQSYVDRKVDGQPDSSYTPVSVVGYGLSYVDTNVVNGTTYDYLVTAFDTNYNRVQATASATPSATGTLTVIPTPGDAYVSLTWNAFYGGSYVVESASQAAGPFNIISGTLTGSHFINAPLQNGIPVYYKVLAQTPYGTIVSAPTNATPSANLACLPPSNFIGITGNGQILLSWSAVPGASSYRLSQLLPPDFLLTNTSATSYAFTVPAGATNGAYTFDLEDVNAQGWYSPVTSITVDYTNLAAGAPGDDSQVTLSIGSHTVAVSGDAITNFAPTNLVLTASINATNSDGGLIYFYDGDNVIGSAPGPVAQMTWFNVPGGTHVVSAQATTTPGSDLSQYFGVTSTSVTYNSPACLMTVFAVPPLETYQTSAADLTLPAPGLPITLSRSYNSQTTNSPEDLGIGWTPSWCSASLQIANGSLATGWVYGGTADIAYGTFFMGESASHLITVTLPGGSSVYFTPTLDGQGNPIDDLADALVSFTCYSLNGGTLQCDGADSGGNDVTLGSGTFLVLHISPGTFTYTTPGGTQYRYVPSGPNWVLSQIIDPNGNSLTYSYTNSGLVSKIAHSNGRQVQFSYVTNTSPPGTWINVQDTSAVATPTGYTNVVCYLVLGNPTNGLLAEVDKLTDRVNGTYERTTYSYGTDATRDLNRLTQTFDGRGIMVVSNQYSTANDGTLANQFDALGHQSSFILADGVQQVVRTVSGSSQTNTVNYAPSGAIAQVLQPNNNPNYTGTSYTYDNQGNLTSQTDSYGYTQSTTYDSSNRPVGQSDAMGYSTSVQLDAAGHPLLSTDANGNNTTNAYDGNGNLTSSQDPTGTASQSAYTTLMSADGTTIAAAGLVTSSSQQVPGMPYSTVTSYTYYQNTAAQPTGNFTGEIQSTAQQWVDAGGNPCAPIVPPTSYQYDANGNRTQQMQTATVNGVTNTAVTTSYQYDAENRLVATVDPLGRASGTVYDKAGRAFMTTDVDGRTTTNTYDAIGNLIETAYPDGTVSRMTYDELNHVLYTQDRSVPNSSGSTTNAATLNIYDGAGRVVCVERLAGTILTKQVNTAVVARSGADTIYQMTSTSPGAVVSFTRSVYDLDGRVQYAMAANGSVTEYRYDADGRRTNVLVYTDYTVDLSNITNAISPSGAALSTQYRYDPNGNQVAMIDANGNETDYQYDSASRLVLTTYPLVSGAAVRTQTATVYDGMGNKVRTIDEAGVPTACTYDFRGLLTSVTLDAGSPGQLIYEYAYDEMGNLIKQTDAKGNVTQFQYDALGRRTQRMLPDGSMETTAYADVPCPGNAAVNVQQTSVTDFRGKTIVTTEDVMNRLASKVLPPINPGETETTETWSYTAAGQVSSVVTSNGGVAIRSVYYDYDNLNRLVQKDTPEGVLAYSYTPDSHVQGIQGYRRSAVAVNGTITNGTTPDVSLGYAYDYAGRLAGVTNNLQVTPNVTGYTYDPVGDLAESVYPNGLRHDYAYNAENRLVEVGLTNGNGTELQTYSYDLSPTGMRTNIIESAGASIVRQIRYGYDSINPLHPKPRVNRLTVEDYYNYENVWQGEIEYGYDAAGNRTGRTVDIWEFTPYDSLTNQSFAFDHRDLIDSDNVPNNANPNYDANGNTLVDNGTNTGDLYDAENRLISTGSDVTLTYDADGNRVSKTKWGETTYYLVDDLNPTGYSQVLAEYASLSSAPNTTYQWGLGLISQQPIDDNRVYYGYDGQGNVRMLLDNTGLANTIATYDYDGYGDLLASSDPGYYGNNYRYCGYEWDGDLGMYYNRARYYKPSLGRFWTRDTYEGDQEDPLSLHKYLYSRANPVNGIDPDGNDLVSNFIYGKKVHDFIGADFVKSGPRRVYNQSIGVTLGLLQAVLKRPDLVDIKNHQVYEIKPILSAPLGASQLLKYLVLFRYFDSTAGWGLGTAQNYPDMPTVVPLGFGAEALVSPAVDGLIIYRVVDVKVLAAEAVVVGAIAFNADIQASLGIATLDDELAY